MDFTRAVSPSKSIIVQTNEKHPNLPVLTFLAVAEKGKKTIKLNRKAYELLGVTEEKHNLVLVEKYNLSDDPDSVNEDDFSPAIGLTSEKVVKIGKSRKTYEIALHTRNVKSQLLHEFVMDFFGLNEKENNYILLTPAVGDAFTMSVLDEVYDKGEEVLIESAPSNTTNQSAVESAPTMTV